MAVPTLLPTNTQNETFGGVTYHIQGELVPALQVELSNTGIYFEHHVLLWKDPAVTVASRIIAIRFYFPIDLPGRRRSIGGTIQRATWL
jgi:uncharacterized protein (AIM24 family)